MAFKCFSITNSVIHVSLFGDVAQYYFFLIILMCYCKFIFIPSLNGVGDAVQGLASIVQCLLLAFVTWFFLLFSLSK